jgi:hypothetical protein
VVVDFPPTPPGSVRNKADRRKILRKLYGQCWWIDIDRIDAEIVALIEHDPSQAERFFLNRVHAGESVAFDLERWMAQQATQPEGRRFVTLGVDGARFDDAVAVVACDIETGHLWPVKIITRPEQAGDDYEHDMAALDGAVREVFADHDVWTCTSTRSGSRRTSRRGRTHTAPIGCMGGTRTGLGRPVSSSASSLRRSLPAT